MKAELGVEMFCRAIRYIGVRIRESGSDKSVCLFLENCKISPSVPVLFIYLFILSILLLYFILNLCFMRELKSYVCKFG